MQSPVIRSEGLNAVLEGLKVLFKPIEGLFIAIEEFLLLLSGCDQVAEFGLRLSQLSLCALKLFAQFLAFLFEVLLSSLFVIN